MARGPRDSPSRTETLRTQLREALRSEYFLTIRDLSQALRVAERELYDHLEHLARSLARGDERLIIEPARCQACEFEFEERTRFTKPGKCPNCKATRIAPPRFRIESR